MQNNVPITIQRSNGLNMNEWVVTYLEPVIEETSQKNEETFLKCMYFDCKKQMSPVLQNGDSMLLRKIDKINDWGSIHMLQTNSSNIVCRPQKSTSVKDIILNFEDNTFGGHGQTIPASAITGVWELIASTRIHANLVTA